MSSTTDIDTLNTLLTPHHFPPSRPFLQVSVLGCVRVYQAQTGAAVRTFSVRRPRHSTSHSHGLPTPPPPVVERNNLSKAKPTSSSSSSQPQSLPLHKLRDPLTGQICPVVKKAALDHQVGKNISYHIVSCHIVSCHPITSCHVSIYVTNRNQPINQVTIQSFNQITI